MDLKIRNFRGIERAAIKLDPIALVAGLNASGKTSIAQAFQALLTGETVPVDGVSKANAASLIHAGMGSGEISLETEHGSSRIEYPQAKKVTEDDPPSASQIAAGMISFPDMETKARAVLLHDYLRCGPSRTDLEKAAKPIELSDEHIEKLWQMIQGQGWDAAHKLAREKGIELKGAWREKTGENYGSNKAGTWIPKDWEFDLDGASGESLQALVTQAQEWRDGVIGQTAISEEYLDQLRLSAKKLEGRKDRVEILTEETEEANNKVRGTADALNNAPNPDAEIETIPCWSCGVDCVILGKTIAKPPPAMSSEENTKIRLEGEEAVKNHTTASLALKQLNDRLVSAGIDLAHSEKNAAELVAAEKLDGTASDDDALEKTNRDLQHAKDRLEALKQKTRADRLHVSIGQNQQVLDILAPDGLRAVKMKSAIAIFNQRLGEIAGFADWAPAEITDGLSILYRGMTWSLCSESEKFRARVMIQTALAEIDGSDALVIDGADTLVDKKLRNGLLNLLVEGIRIPALFCMALPDRESMPDLGALGFGRSYWIENGIAE